MWSPTERKDGMSPEKHPGSERWPLGTREPLSRFPEAGLGAVLFVRACRAIAYRMAIPSWPVWEPTSFSYHGLEYNLSNPSVGVDSRNDSVQLAAPPKASLGAEVRIMTISKIGLPTSGFRGFLPVDSSLYNHCV